ncbi:MAG: response regulator [Candidatus Cloacimonadota bacterium]|nr:response regulator [Candidatus Cloacimonadota bacterium]
MKEIKVLWIDDEIEMLKPHILFLEEKNYRITTSSNGNDGIKLVEENNFDIVLLDEMMPGLDGLETLTEIKKLNETLPIVMVTKNEEEGLMNKAISHQISDYIIKPINPNQVLMSLKKIVMSEEIRRERTGEEYAKFSAWYNRKMFTQPELEDLFEIFLSFVEWDIKLDNLNYDDLLQIHSYERKNFNSEFSNFIKSNYVNFVQENKYAMSHNIVEKYVIPKISKKKPTYFIVLDCLRADQLLAIRPYLEELFNVDISYYLSILPTSTPYARNAIFAGMLPKNIAKRFPQYWQGDDSPETSRNRYEHFLVDDLMKRKNVSLPKGSKYTKILNQEEGEYVTKKIPSYKNERFIVLVYNFLDMLLHHRFKDEVLREMLPNDRALRSLTKIWFLNSNLYKSLKLIAKQDATVFITTDHGSIKVEHASKVISDKKATPGLRSKHGRNVSCDENHAMRINDLGKIGIPAAGLVDSFIFAKGDYYFVYPTDYNEYKKKFHGTYQHGGISMDEMILPIATLTTKK